MKISLPKFKKLKNFKKAKKAILTIFLASNLTIIATGSAQINQPDNSTDLTNQSTRSSQLETAGGLIGGPAPQSRETPPMLLDSTGQYVADELIVRFKENFPEEGQKGILNAINASFTREELLLSEGVKVLKVDPNDRDKTTKMLKNNPNIEYVELNPIVKLEGGGGGVPPGGCFPNDYYYCYGDYQWALRRIQAPSGWNLNKGSSSIAIAVIDSGVDYNHYDLYGKVIKGTDWWNYFEYPNDPMDENGHGTGVSGIAAASTNNFSAMAGVGWYTRIVAIKVTDPNGRSNVPVIASGIRDAVINYPDNNVKVINLSLRTEPDTDSSELSSAIRYAQDHGIVVIASVKNSTPGNYNCFMGFPAAYPGVISVVATDKNDMHGSGCTGRTFNNKQYQNVWVSAPGAEIFSLKKNSGFGYLPGTETSWAAPFVSGIASILANGPSNCNNASLISLAIQYGTDDLGTAGWDMKYGQGRVNLYKALDLLCY
ncbi:MAG: Protease [Candidatus Woesebacteria bacterium GW2011_GWB1_41_10]|uniref:Protease n=2 Tax=Microgenomates group TaxID=1794810 RepID=A0A0G0RD93_9BACT|nr:MAG: Protease [Candidatus Curtissbacteria bacterium GW2011_GWA1_40_16]KKR86516.1 MAG: Protease [Candidatus Woesebacteria bacterium GW2011_GWB1_41_10]